MHDDGNATQSCTTAALVNFDRSSALSAQIVNSYIKYHARKWNDCCLARLPDIKLLSHDLRF